VSARIFHRRKETSIPWISTSLRDELHKELDKIVDKLRSSIGSQGDTDDEVEEDENLQYKLVVRDPTWDEWYYNDYSRRNRAN